MATFKYLFILFSTIALEAIYPLSVKGQNVRLITARELESRLNSGKDTTYIINFWATWCVPCLRELPNFEKLQQESAGKKLKVILLSIDNKARMNSAVTSYVKRQKLKNEVLVADEQKPQHFISKIDNSWSGSLPATLVVNKSKNQRKFFEKEFSYAELLEVYNSLN